MDNDKWNVKMAVGATLREPMWYQDDDEQPIDITGVSVTYCAVTGSETRSYAANVIDAANGHFEIYVPDSETVTWAAGLSDHQIWFEWPNGDNELFLDGQLNLVASLNTAP